MEPIGILDLLSLKGFDTKRPAKLVRHQDADLDMHDLLRRGWFEAYQGFQSQARFDDCDFVISCIGLEGTKARFVGVYRRIGRRNGHEAPLPTGCPYVQWTRCDYFYEFRCEPGFEDLENRVVIEWGKGTRAWYQWLSNKPVVELLPPGQLRPPFRDYLEFTLTHAELVDLFSHEEANREWRARLAAVAGVYLILATTTGAQYVGSAYGAEGIWGRWEAYAANGHGGNIKLRELLEKDGAYRSAFSYSILQILPKTLAQREVLDWERRYKEKLGSRVTGLNVN